MTSTQTIGVAAAPGSSGRAAHWRHNWDKAILPGVFMAMLAVFYLLDARTLSPNNLVNVLTQVSILAIVTIGASVVIFSGGFDLSAGAVVALSAVLAALTVDATGDVWLGVSAGILIGLLVGSLNGFFVGYLNVSPLIVTLGALNICRGLALVLAKDGAVYSFPPWYTDFGALRFLGIPSLAWIAILLFVLVGLLLRLTPFGLNLYASGGNPKAARLSGVPVQRMKLMAFAISGACCGVAGVLLTVRSGGGDPTSGMLYELEAIAAVVLGGAALSGGEGKLWRSMLAILLLAVLANGLNIVGVHPHWKGVVIGAILTIAATLDALKRAR